MNEDPQLSHKLKYSLKDLPVYVGRKHGNPTPHIVLSGIGIKVNHAIFYQNSKGQIVIKPNENDAKDFIFINGKQLIDLEGTALKTKDKITFGTNSIMLFMEKSDGRDIYDIDWESAQLELQNEIEMGHKQKEEENKKKKQNELEIMKRDLEEKYSREKNEMEENLRRQLQDYENKLTEMNKSVEKQNIDNLFKQQTEQKEIELAKKRKEQAELQIDTNDIMKRDPGKVKSQTVHNSQKLEHTIYIIKKKIEEIKQIIAFFSRNLYIEMFLSKNIQDAYADNNTNGFSHINIVIRVIFIF